MKEVTDWKIKTKDQEKNENLLYEERCVCVN